MNCGEAAVDRIGAITCGQDGRIGMNKSSIVGLLLTASIFIGCSQQIGEYEAASSISRNGFAKDAKELRARQGQEIAVWGYIDHANVYGDAGTEAILGEWWSGDGPDAAAWQFNVMANEEDAVGNSFAVLVPNDAGRDALLERFVADARAQKPTKVFVTGTLNTFDAPTAETSLTGLFIQAHSSSDVVLDSPPEE